jgi:hypothetical protein
VRARRGWVYGVTWNYNCQISGQRIYWPPDVGGWNDDAWLDTNSMLGRWQTVYLVTAGEAYGGGTWNAYDATETADDALAKALAYWDNPTIRPQTLAGLKSFAEAAVPVGPDAPLRAQRMNALRHLIATSPDYQVC